MSSLVSSGGPHKVFLQKRSGDLSPNMQTKTVSCSLCPDTFPGPKELGLHILTAHCNNPEPPEDLVIDGSPGTMMEVEDTSEMLDEDESVDPLDQQLPGQSKDHLQPLLIQFRQVDSGKPAGLPSLNLPRQPNANELKQKFMVYRLSDTSCRYICLVCDKMYTSRYNIRMHMNLHTGNNVHKCAFCGRNFAHKHVYESHVRTHTGERPFSCDKCDRRFGDRSNCSSHRKRCPGVGGGGCTPPESPTGEEVGKSITIAPNVSITPIMKNKKVKEGEVFSYPEMDSEPTEDLALTFEPQIVSVESVTKNGDNLGDLTNMGYTGEEEEEEEMMIEPDISLDYDDIEEMMEEPDDKTVMTVQKPVSSTIYTCSFCNVKYSQQNMLLEHLTTHIDIPEDPKPSDIEQGFMTIYYSSRPKFMCLACGKLFATAESVNLHLNIHYEDKMYACEHCDKIFGHKHVYENHRKVVHPVTDRKECHYCHNIYPTVVSLDNHERNCSSKPQTTNIILKINTPDAINKNNINNNINYNNNNNADKVNDTTTTNTQTDEIKKTKPKANRPPPKLILLNSDPSEYRNTNLDDNIIIKTEVENIVMKTDSDIYTSSGVLTPKPTMTLLSEEAKMIFNSSAPIQVRRSSGSNPRAHKIVETDAGREYIPDTNSNNILHLEGIFPPPENAEKKKGYMLRPVGPGGQQRYICVDCGKHYTTSYNVRMHRNIHLGKNLYTCQYCQKEFSHKHVWETHERVHTGERPFKCPTCPKDFADRSNYNSHKKICLRLQQQAFGSTGVIQSTSTIATSPPPPLQQTLQQIKHELITTTIATTN